MRVAFTTCLILTACNPLPIAIGWSEEPYRAPVEEWLTNTTWKCTYFRSVGADVYRVEYTWTWGEGSYSSDAPERSAEAINGGDWPSTANTLLGWVYYEPTQFGGRYVPVYSLNELSWFGISDDTVWVEWGSDPPGGGAGERVRIHRYDDSPDVRATFEAGNGFFIGDCILQD